MIRSCLAAAVVLLLVVACGGKSKSDNVNLSYNEKCTSCGMEWTVAMIDHSDKGARIRVDITNTGERGALTMTFDRVASYLLNADAAKTWAGEYVAARQANNAFNKLQELIPAATRWQPASNTQLPTTLATGQSWTGEFTTTDNVTTNVEGIVFVFTNVTYERPLPGTRVPDFWVTWDLTRPYVGVHGEATLNN